MSLFNDTLRPPAILSDQAVERYLAAIRAEIEPDPLFRRRLRGQVMNRFVATREGMVATPPRRAMGRVGRAVLYSSFALAATTTSVLAASQEALPGDVLYPLKRQVERLRVEVLPAHLQDDLAAYALGERIEELGALAERGDAARVAVLAAIVERDYEAFVAANPDASSANEHHLTVLLALLDRLPEAAQTAIGQVIERESGRQNLAALKELLERLPESPQAAFEEVPERPAGGSAPSGDDAVRGGSDQPAQGGSTGGSTPTNATGPGEPEETIAPAPTPKPSKSPGDDATPKPSKSPRPDPASRNDADSDNADNADEDDGD